MPWFVNGCECVSYFKPAAGAAALWLVAKIESSTAAVAGSEPDEMDDLPF